MKKLSKKELQELKGGVAQALNMIDAKNTNSVSGCYCSYNDNGVTENNNTVEGCKCNCSKTNAIII